MRRIPYVIDNLETRLADVLNDLLERQRGQNRGQGHQPLRRRRAEGLGVASMSTG
jgi:hypothetical protein